MFFFFQAEDGIRDLVRSRGLGDVYKRQPIDLPIPFVGGETAGEQTLVATLRRLDTLDDLAALVLHLSLIHI